MERNGLRHANAGPAPSVPQPACAAAVTSEPAALQPLCMRRLPCSRVGSLPCPSTSGHAHLLPALLLCPCSRRRQSPPRPRLHPSRQR